jgi:hypothetical protein
MMLQLILNRFQFFFKRLHPVATKPSQNDLHGIKQTLYIDCEDI